MTLFKGKIVWITGASSGIGEAMATIFKEKGAKLVLSSRREDELIRVKDKLQLSDEDCLVLPLDLSDMKEVDKYTQQVIDKFGRIDVLVNNGGISQRSLIKDTSVDVDRRMMEINFFGAIALTKSVLPHMIRQNSGNIIVTSSIMGKFGYYWRSMYAASKHALHGFFESLRMEVAHNNIDVLIVCPGYVKTNVSINAINAKGEKYNSMDKGQEQGMDPVACARSVIRAAERGKAELLIGGKETKAVLVKRFFPAIFFAIMRKMGEKKKPGIKK